MRLPKPLWVDDYFDVDFYNKTFLNMFIRSQYTQPAPKGMGGLGAMSKQVTPSDCGESREHQVHSLLLLKAWAWWWANFGNWATERKCRITHAAQHLALLERDVKALRAPCKLLGNKKANRYLTELVPGLVARLRSS